MTYCESESVLSWFRYCDVEAISRNKDEVNSASCWSCYTDTVRCTVNKTLNLAKKSDMY
jgi:hypothetical protein